MVAVCDYDTTTRIFGFVVISCIAYASIFVELRSLELESTKNPRLNHLVRMYWTYSTNSQLLMHVVFHLDYRTQLASSED